MGKFVIKNTGTGIKFDLKASSGEIIAVSTGSVCGKGGGRFAG